MDIYFTADLHFGHKGIIEHCKRPFRDVHEMDRALIQMWNSTVKPGDIVYILGDFTFKTKPDYAIQIAKSLNGQKQLVFGNHDERVRSNKDFLACFVWTGDLKTVKIPDETAPDGKRKIALCHFPLRTWDGSHRGSWHLHGHEHGGLPEDDYLAFDVGIDCNGYKLVPYEEVRKRLTAKEKTLAALDFYTRSM